MNDTRPTTGSSISDGSDTNLNPTNDSFAYENVSFNIIRSEVHSNDRDLESDRVRNFSNKELWAWYVYELASHPYSVVALSIFIPLVIQDLAYHAGTSDLGKSVPCFVSNSTNATTTSQTSTTSTTTTTHMTQTEECWVQFGATWISPTSYTLYVQAISVGLQAFTFISFGALADHSRFRKHLLLVFGTIGAVSCLGYALVLSPAYLTLAAVLAIVGNVAYGTATVFYYAYLPLLVDAKVDAINEKQTFKMKMLTDDDGNLDAKSNSDDSLNQSISVDDEGCDKKGVITRDLVANEISTKGFMIAYLSGVFVLILCSVYLFLAGPENVIYKTQLAIAFVGVWWLLFQFGFTAWWLKPRPGPPLPPTERSYFIYSWKKTWKTVRHARQLRHTFFFLLSWFIYSDGYSTIGGVAILFGKTTLNMSSTQLLLVALLAPLTASIGNYFFYRIVYRFLHLSSRTTLLLLLSLLLLIPLYGLLGFIFPGSPVGLQSITELYILACYYGFLLGALQSFSRVVFSDLIPPGMETEFFALYEVTDKGSSWLGPVLVGVCTDVFGNVRYGFIVLAFMIAISIPVLWMVDVEEGKKQAERFKVE